MAREIIVNDNQHVRRPALLGPRRYKRAATARAAEFQRKVYASPPVTVLPPRWSEPWLRGGLNE